MAAVENLQRHRLHHAPAAPGSSAGCGRAASAAACASSSAPSGMAPASRLSARLQHIAAAAHRMQEARLARIGLDLAAQPGDLHIDRPLAGLVHAERRGDVLARQHLVRLARQHGQQRRLAAGQADRCRPARAARRAPDRMPAAPSGTGPLGAPPAAAAAARGAAWRGCAAPVRAGRTAWADSRRRRPRTRRCGPPARRARSAAAPARRHFSARSDSVRSRPLSPGIITSSTIRSGCRKRSLSRASAALAAVVTRKPFSPR